MNVLLRKLRDDELPAFGEVSMARYVQSIELHGGVPHELAAEKARRDFEALWPDGRPGPEHHIYAVEKDGFGIGFLWLAERDSHGRKVVWVYDVWIDEEHRGRGLGREAMRLAEQETRMFGGARLELNVFGRNDVARGLYRSLGYEESAILMGKDLE